jgi:hypothetical protein
MAQLVGQPERRDAVDDAEIDGLGPAADGRVHVLDRHVEHLRCGHGVNVQTIRESLLELRNVGDMGQHAQLDLAVVCRHQLVALSATKAVLIWRPSAVRTGMFCRLGSVEASRPVEVAASE